MSSPYGPPGGQQGPGSYGGPSGAPWGPGQGGTAYGSQPPGGYGQGVPQSPTAAPGQGFAPAYGSGSAQGGPTPGGPEASGSRASSRAKPKTAIDFGRILALAIGALGVLAFFFGFLSAWKLDQQGSNASISVYATAGAYLPILLLLTGLLALAPLVPRGRKYTFPTTLLGLVGFLAALTQLISGDGSYGANLSVGIGLILLLIVSLIQAAAAAYSWLNESGMIPAPATSGPRPARAKKPAAAEPAPKAPAPQFGPPASAPDQRTGTPAGYGAGYAPSAYPAGGYPSGGSGQPADPAAYGGYRPGPYSPANPPAAEPRNPYATPTPDTDRAPQQFGTGATPAVDAGPLDDSPFRPGGRYSETPATGPNTGQHGRDDGPSPDETQQVRF